MPILKNIREKLAQKKEPIKEEPQIFLKKDNIGKLSIDAYETDTDFVVRSTIAGVQAKDLDISVENNILLIKGVRVQPKDEKIKNYFYKECFWGPFERRILLPHEVNIEKAKATVKNGVLILKIPKIEKQTTKEIKIENS